MITHLLDHCTITVPPSKGGQHVGVDSTVIVTHEPTGVQVICGAARSQHKNKEIALLMIEFGLSLV